MKTKLFENVGGNKFKLLRESVNINEAHVTSGLKKVFMNAGDKISYNQVESVGMGYIKDIPTAKRVALEEARVLAKEYGYKDSEEESKFVKDSANTRMPKLENDETNMNNPAEKREVQIGKTIVNLCDKLYIETHDVNKGHVQYIKKLAEELIQIHGQQQ